MCCVVDSVVPELPLDVKVTFFSPCVDSFNQSYSWLHAVLVLIGQGDCQV